MRFLRLRSQLLPMVVASGLAWALFRAVPAEVGRAPAQSAAPSSTVFTPAHRTALDAVRDFFGRRRAPVQPIAYTHKLHLANGLQCINCHTGVDTGPDAALPSVKLCMTCHQFIAADRPEIRKLTAYFERGEEIPWQRVYNYSQSAHVKFNHAPHIRARVGCRARHADVTPQTVAA